MAVKIRLQRQGNKNRPYYRIVVADSRSPRDGRFVEIVGTYDPVNQNRDKQIDLKLDRADYWLGVGAQPSDTARTIINRVRREGSGQVTIDAAEKSAVEEPKPGPGAIPVTEEAVPEAPVTEEVAAEVVEAESKDTAQAAGEAIAEEAMEQVKNEVPEAPSGGPAEANASAMPPEEAEVKAAEEDKKEESVSEEEKKQD